MDTYIFILGRSPELSIEELLIVLKPLGHIVEITKSFVVFQGSIDAPELLSRLGGTIKIARSAKPLNHITDFTVEQWLALVRPELRQTNGRFHFGASLYGFDDKARRHIFALGLELKKHIQNIPVKARFISNAEGVLSSVVIRKNNLINRELILVRGKKVYVAVTCAVQDFDSYTLRDYGRPSRNMQRGMLPPKLAQIMLNLARAQSTDTLLDPFCGGGTVLQEALLRGLKSVWGSDIDERAIAEAKNNFAWLAKQFNFQQPHLAVQNALEPGTRYEHGFFDIVVTEPFLGPARLLRQRSFTRANLETVLKDCQQLYMQLFSILPPLCAAHARLVIVFPVFMLFGGKHHVGSLKIFERFGWKCVPPSLTDYIHDASLSERGQLIYSRDDQVVAREITVWERAS